MENIFYLAAMTIDAAFKQLVESPEFKEACRGEESPAVKNRVYLGRFRKGALKAGAMVEVLMANGYEVRADKVTKRRKTTAATPPKR